MPIIFVLVALAAAGSIALGVMNLIRTGVWPGQRDLDLETWQARLLFFAVCMFVVGCSLMVLGL